MNVLGKTTMLHDIIIVTKNALSTHVKNYIKTINGKPYPVDAQCTLSHSSLCNCFKLNIYSYVYDLFIIIIPTHILIPPHHILTKDEAEYLINNELRCRRINLPKIKIYDPQIIWSPGGLGDIVKIVRNNDVGGLEIYHRLVVN